MNASLLPLGSTPLMRAVSLEGAARRDDFPAELVGASWDPWTCDAALLDWLASAASVDVWVPAWDDLRKRAAIAAAPGLHQVKGTLEGIARHLAEAGGELRQAVTPSKRVFATPTVTKEVRDAWLERMPQIRVYLGNEKGSARGLSFNRQGFAGHGFARFDAGAGLYGRRAELVDGDQVTPLRRARLETTERQAEALELERVFIPGGKAPALYAGRAFLGQAYMALPVSPPRVVTYALRRSYAYQESHVHLDTVSPGLEPLEVGHTRISAKGVAGRSAFAGRGVNRFASADRAPWLLYDRVLLQDGRRDGPWVRAHSFAGHARLAPPRFTATLLVDAPGRLPSHAAVARTWIAGRSFSVPHDVAPLASALAAVRVSKAHRDRVLVDAATFRPRQFADRIPLDGSFRFGAQVPRSL